VNVTVENLGACKRLVRVELAVEDVNRQIEELTREFLRQAHIPGFRPGKAPREMVERRFEKEILEEAKKKLLRESYNKAIEEQKLKVFAVLAVEDIQFERGKPMQFAATIEVQPAYELPAYVSLPAVIEETAVADGEVDRAVDLLREQQAKYEPVQREAGDGDAAVIGFVGTCEGKNIAELAPNLKAIGQAEKTWVRIEPGQFLPGFAEQLKGAKAGDQRTVTVEFPPNFAVPALAGKQGVYQVTVQEIREKRLPGLDDAFARTMEAADLTALRNGVRRDLENEVKYRQSQSVRSQVIHALLSKVDFDLPESAVKAETRNVVYDIVADIQRRGADREQVEKKKEEIYTVASKNARDRVKLGFLLDAIAARENIKVTEEEFSQHLLFMASQQRVPAKDFVKELEKREALPEVHRQLIHEKVIAFLSDKAEVRRVAPSAGGAAPAEA